MFGCPCNVFLMLIFIDLLKCMLMILYCLWPSYITTIQKVTGALHKPQIPGPSSAQASSHAQATSLWSPTSRPGSWHRHATNGSLTLTHTYTVVLPRVNLMWQLCTCSPLHAHTHTTILDITGLPSKTTPYTSAPTSCAQQQLSSHSQRCRHKPPPRKPTTLYAWCWETVKAHRRIHPQTKFTHVIDVKS